MPFSFPSRYGSRLESNRGSEFVWVKNQRVARFQPLLLWYQGLMDSLDVSPDCIAASAIACRIHLTLLPAPGAAILWHSRWIIASTESIPINAPTGLNFLFGLDTGVHINLTKHQAINACCKLLHISNAYTSSFIIAVTK
jgi:hypothetical protein